MAERNWTRIATVVGLALVFGLALACSSSSSGDGTDTTGPGTDVSEPGDTAGTDDTGAPPIDVGCEPNCGGRVCGPDPVCGTSCGTCTTGVCTAAGACECEAECGTRECGPDPVCGSSCGNCGIGFQCNDGTCEEVSGFFSCGGYLHCIELCEDGDTTCLDACRNAVYDEEITALETLEACLDTNCPECATLTRPDELQEIPDRFACWMDCASADCPAAWDACYPGVEFCYEVRACEQANCDREADDYGLCRAACLMVSNDEGQAVYLDLEYCVEYNCEGEPDFEVCRDHAEGNQCIASTTACGD